MRISVLNGPNLNLLGTREPGLYGTDSLERIEARLRERAHHAAVDLTWTQTNGEKDLVELIQRLPTEADGALVNAAAYTHTSLAIRDALLAVGTPFVEVHLTNIFGREPERRVSLMADIAVGIVAGFGSASYELAFDGLVSYLRGRER